MFNHSGSYNLGCEAIIISTIKILEKARPGNEFVLSSYRPHEDLALKNSLALLPFEAKALKATEHARAYINYHLFKNESYSIKKAYSDFLVEAKKSDLCLSVGGDTYCYSDNPIIRLLSEEILKSGKKLFLWGASIGKEDLDDKKVKNLSNFSGIFARESLTYDLLNNENINENVFLYPDPAFNLDGKTIKLPTEIEKQNTVGINISPLICEQNETVLKSMVKLAVYITENTDMTLVLVAHVKAGHKADKEILRKFYKLLPSSVKERIIEFDDNLNSEQTKYLISKLRFLICARTHASIAAYSSGVPTLVLGYSVKAQGIAKDILGCENYVVDVREKRFEERLFNEFFKLMKNEKYVREKLEEKAGKIKEASLKAGEKLMDIL